MKNFGILYNAEGFRLAPFYDIVAAAQYSEYRNSGLALRMGARQDPASISAIGPQHLSELARGFNIAEKALEIAVEDLRHNLITAEEKLQSSPFGSSTTRERLTDYMRKRWNGTFDSIGKRSR